MLADTISTGHGWAADVFFLVAVVLAVVAAVLHALASRPRPAERRADGTLVTLHEHFWTPVLGWLALGFVALGLLVL